MTLILKNDVGFPDACTTVRTARYAIVILALTDNNSTGLPACLRITQIKLAFMYPALGRSRRIHRGRPRSAPTVANGGTASVLR
jgi:hypothetical protein